MQGLHTIGHFRRVPQACAEAYHSNWVGSGDDGPEEERLDPRPAIGEGILVDNSHDHHVDADAGEREGEDMREVAGKGVPVE